MKSFSGRLFSHEKSESWKVKDNFYFQSFMGFYQTLQEIFLEFPMAFFFFFSQAELQQLIYFAQKIRLYLAFGKSEKVTMGL